MSFTAYFARRVLQHPPTTRQIAFATATAVTTTSLLCANRDRILPHAAAETKPELMQAFGFLGFRSLKLDSVEEVNHDTKRFRFALPDGDESVSGIKLTSALLSMSWPTGRWTPVLRPYTPVGDLSMSVYMMSQFPFLTMLQMSLATPISMIKRYPDGKQSTHVHSLQPGDSLTFFGYPLPGYSWTPNKHSHVMLIAGGAGVTPIYQLTKGILNSPEDKTKITLVRGTNTDADVFLKDEFDELEKKFPGRFATHYTISKPTPRSTYLFGRVTSDFLKMIVSESEFEKAKEGKIFLCGPPAMEEAVAGKWGMPSILKELGFKKYQLHRF